MQISLKRFNRGVLTIFFFMSFDVKVLFFSKSLPSWNINCCTVLVTSNCQ